MKLIFFEFQDHVAAFLDHCQRNSLEASQFLVVALQPEVKRFCKEKGVNHTDTLPFFNNSSHQRVLKKSNQLTTLIRDELKLLGPSPLKNSYLNTFIYHSRFYINNFLWFIDILGRISQKYQDLEIYIYNPSNSKDPLGYPRTPFLSKKDCFIPSLTEKYCEAHGINYVHLKDSTAMAPQRERRHLTSSANVLKKLATALLIRKLNKLIPLKIILLTSLAYNLERLGKQIKERFPDVGCITPLPGDLSFLKYLRIIMKLLIGRYRGEIFPVPMEFFNKGDPQEVTLFLNDLKAKFNTFLEQTGDEFSYENCSIKEEFRNKVKGSLLPVLAEIFNKSSAQVELLKYVKPKLLISPVSTLFNHSWAEGCKEMGIPALVIPQKGLVAPNDECAKLEEYHIGKAQVSDDFGFVAAQSPLILDYLNWSGYGGTILKVGNLIFSRLFAINKEEKRERLFPHISQEKRILVYAPSMKSRKSRRFWVVETLDELLCSIGDMVDAVSKMKDVHLVLRIHPGEPITRKEIEGLVPLSGNISVSDNGSFEDVLTIADLLISFSSTSIQESLFNGIPVVLYDRWKRYNHLNTPAVMDKVPQKISAVYYFNNPGNLSTAIPWILRKHRENVDSKDLFRRYTFPASYNENFYSFINECTQRK